MKFLMVLLAFILFIQVVEINSNKPQTGILSRSKRYVAFPDGSTVVFALCQTAQLIAPFQVFTEGVNWGMAFELPNRTSLTSVFKKKRNKYVERRRHRRDLYNKMETILESMGFDGRSCILKALCESSTIDALPKRGTLYEEIIRLLFKFPQQTISLFEPAEHRLYHWAYRKGMENKQQDCADMFPACSISLIDLALGYYNDYQIQEDSDQAISAFNVHS